MGINAEYMGVQNRATVHQTCLQRQRSLLPTGNTPRHHHRMRKSVNNQLCSSSRNFSNSRVNQKFKWGDNYSGNRAFPFNKQTLAVYHCNNNHCIVWATCLTSASLTMEDGVCFNFSAPAFPWSRWANGLRSDRPASICLYGSLPLCYKLGQAPLIICLCMQMKMVLSTWRQPSFSS